MTNLSRFRLNDTAKHRLKVAALLLAVLAAGACLTWGVVSQANREMRARMLQETQMFAQAVDAEHLQTLSGTEADLTNLTYQRLKEQLVTARSTNPLCRFIYLLGRKPDGAVFFFVDSEPATSKDYSPPGQVYYEAAEGIYRAFTSQTEVVEGPYTDRWGNWVSAFTPIFEPKASVASDKVLAVFGMDIDARDWVRMLVLSGVPPALLTLALALILLAGSVLLERRSWSDVRPRRPIGNLGIELVAAVGIVLTLFAAWMAHDRETHNRDEAFRRLAVSRTAAIAEDLHELRDMELEGLALFCETNPTATAEEFKRYTAYLTKNPAIQAWEWIPAVAEADKPRFEGQARAAGWTGFEIWQKDAQGKQIPATGRDFYYPVFQAAPLAGNERAVGYDTGSEPRRRAALEAAARTGLVTGTDPITLVQEAGDQKGMLIYRPVFSGENPGHLLGFAMAVLRMGTFLVDENTVPPLPMQLSLLRKDAAPELLAATGDTGGLLVARPSVKRPFFAFGKVFAVTVYSERELMFLWRHPGQASLLALLIGLVLTLTLAILAGVLLRRREERELAQEALLRAHSELEVRVKNRTAELRQSKDRLQLLLDSTAEAIYGIDTQGDCTFCNSACLQMLGYAREDELLGKNMHRQIHQKHADGAHFPLEECRIFRAFQANEGAHVDDEVLWRADGTSFSAEYWSYPQRIDGAAVGAVVTFIDITGRKRTEEERRQLADRLALATKAGQVGIWDWDVANDVLVWDDNMYRQYGITRDEFAGAYEAWTAGLHPDDRERGNEEIQMALRGEKEFDTEFRVLWPDGTTHHIRAMALVQRNAAGVPLHMIGTNWDITELSRTTRLLQESESRFRLMADSAPVLLWESGTDGLCNYFNKLWLDFTGRTLEQELGNGWAKNVHPDDLETCLSTYMEAFHARREFEMEYRLLRADGKYRWLQDHGVPRFTADGNFLGFIGSCLDITDIKQATLTQEELIGRLLKIAGQVPGVIYQYRLRPDGTSCFPFASAAIREIYRVSPEEVSDDASKVFANLHPEDADGVSASILKSAQDLTPWQHEYRVKFADGTIRALYGNAVPQREADGAVLWHGFITDITQRKRSEASILQNLARAEDLARLKSRFVLLASHELRTPLAHIMLACDLLKNFGTTMPAERSQLVLTGLMAGVSTMVQILDDLLLAGKLEEGKLPFTPARFALLDFLKHCCLEVQPGLTLPSRIEIAFRDARLRVTADERLLHHVLKNLLGNALKYSPDDTKVDLGVEAGPDSLTLSVLDRGIGVPEAERQFLFDAFSRASNVGDKPGSGLGLFIAQKCAQAQGGQLRYEPMPNGSVFSVTIPLAKTGLDPVI